MFFTTSDENKLFKGLKLKFVLTSNRAGFSKNSFKGLNLGYHVGDDKALVDKNHAFLKDTLKAKDLYFLNQVHSNSIIDISEYDNALRDADGIICAEKNKHTLIMIADCACVLMYDTRHGVFAILHAGRNGLVEHILDNAFKRLVEDFNTKAKDLLIYISPHIKASSYEIKKPLALELKAKMQEQRYLKAINYKESKYFFSIEELIKFDLLNLGVSPSQISQEDVDTALCKDLYSYRRDNKTGRFGLIAWLTD